MDTNINNTKNEWSESDIICTDKYLNFCINKNSKYQNSDSDLIQYFKHDFLFTDGIWREKNVKSCINNKIKIVVVGHSDYYVDDLIALKIQKETNCSYLFSVNNICSFDWCFPLPLGITNFTNETGLHPIYGNTDIMIEVKNEEINKLENPLIYCNINVYTNYKERESCFNSLVKLNQQNNNSLIYFEKHVGTLQHRKQFLKQLKNHKFIICPEGNGIDTHRLWETLYMGSIPIVKKTHALRGMEDLPILFVNEWNEITKELLVQTYNKFQNKEWNYNKLKIDYWLNILNDKCES